MNKWLYNYNARRKAEHKHTACKTAKRYRVTIRTVDKDTADEVEYYNDRETAIEAAKSYNEIASKYAFVDDMATGEHVMLYEL